MLAKATDIFCTAIFEEESGEFAIHEGPEQRDGLTASVVLPAVWAGKTVHVYAFFQTADQNEACNSVYLGAVNMLLPDPQDLAAPKKPQESKVPAVLYIV